MVDWIGIQYYGNERAALLHDCYVVVHLGELLCSYVPCLVALLVMELHCANSMTTLKRVEARGCSDVTSG